MTITPEGRIKLSEAARKRWEKGGDLRSEEVAQKRERSKARAKRRKKSTPSQLIHVEPKAQEVQPPAQDSSLELTAAAVTGHIFAVIEDYARRSLIPSAILAQRVAELLRHSSRR